MGARGPAPKSKRELERRGSRRAKDRSADLELEAKAPAPPSSLGKEAKAEWKRLVPRLDKKGVLAEVDRAGLTILCEAWAEYQELGKTLKKLMVGGMDWRRIKSAQHEAYLRWQNLAQRFGLTPADRPRVKVNAKPEAKAEGKGRFFKPRIAKAS